MFSLKRNRSFLILLYSCVVCYFLFWAYNSPLKASPDEDSLFYYSNGQKHPLELSKNKLALRFKGGVGEERKKHLIESDQNFTPFNEKKELSRFNLTSMLLREGKSKEDVKQTIINMSYKSEIELVAPVFTLPNAEVIITDEFIVKFKPSVSKEEIDTFNELHDVEIVRKERWTDRYTLKVKNTANFNTIKMANIYYEDPITVFATPNFISKLEPFSTIPDDTYFTNQWHLHNTGQNPPAGTEDADIDAPEGWDINIGNSDVIIAIIDEGVDVTHEDLVDNIIDGYDFVDDDANPSPWGDDAHGTACAGLAAGKTNNNKGIAGVSWNCKIMPIRMASGEFGSYWTTDEWAANAIEWAADNGADVLSNSWGGGPDSDTIHDAIQEAKENGRDGKGCVVVFASGNSGGGVSYPAKYSEVIAVGATDKDDIKWSYSCYGNELDVVAPSGNVNLQGNIWTTDITGSAGYNYGSTSLGDASGDYTNKMGGTSAAAPQVAGLAGLILSINPSLTSDEVQYIIETSADDKGVSGWDQYYGWGRINVYEALKKAFPLDLEIEMIDPNTCVVPEDTVTFEITYGNSTTSNENDPNYIGPAYDTLISYALPAEFDYFNINDPNYNMLNRTFIWDVNTLYPGETGTIQVTLYVTEAAEPLSSVVSKVELDSSIALGQAITETEICHWGGSRIYVDAYASGSKTGVTWDNAYTDLQDALHRAEKSYGLYDVNEIWVAQGIYRPTNSQNQNASFDMVDDLELYGGFRSHANSLSERNYVNYKTYLSGNIDIGGDLDSFIVVNTEPDSEISSNTILDGFIITHSTVAGIYCNEADLVVRNCVITDNDANGIYIYKSDPFVFDSVITDNGVVGVYDCNESLVTIEGCVISKNGGNGISCRKNAAVILKNSWIHNNEGEGIALTDAASGSLIRNNTIVYNAGKGIFAESGYDPTVKNCIMWGNEGGDIISCSATYSCFDQGYQGTGNIDDDPNFVCINPNMYNYHLRYGSPCRDSGDGYYPDEYDIDREPREYGSEIDMGADEIYCTDGTLDDDDVYKALDWNSDGLVNLHEYNYFSAAWLSHDPNDPEVLDPNSPVNDPNDPLYIDPNNRLEGWYEWKYMCNLDDTINTDTEYEIDLADLEMFWNNWLWKACYVSFNTWMHTFGEVEGDTDEMYGSQTSTEMTLNTKSQEYTVAMKPNVEPQNDTVIIEEKSIEEQFIEIQEIATWLEILWSEDESVRQEIDAQQWADFMKQIYDCKDTLENQLIE